MEEESVIASYIKRFRESRPLGPDELKLQREVSKNDFWWTKEENKKNHNNEEINNNDLNNKNVNVNEDEDEINPWKEDNTSIMRSSLSSSNLRKDESVRSTASVDSVLAGYGQQSNNDIRRPLLGLTLPNHAVEHIRNGIETLNRDDVISFAELSIHVG